MLYFVKLAWRLINIYALLYTLTRAAQGWYYMMKDLIEFIKDRRAARKNKRN